MCIRNTLPNRMWYVRFLFRLDTWSNSRDLPTVFSLTWPRSTREVSISYTHKERRAFSTCKKDWSTYISKATCLIVTVTIVTIWKTAFISVSLFCSISFESYLVFFGFFCRFIAKMGCEDIFRRPCSSCKSLTNENMWRYPQKYTECVCVATTALALSLQSKLRTTWC